MICCTSQLVIVATLLKIPWLSASSSTVVFCFCVRLLPQPSVDKRPQTMKGEAVWRGGLKLSIVQHCGAARRPPPLSRVSYYLCVCDHRGFVRYIKRKSKAGVYLVNILLCWILHSNPCSDPIHCALTRLCVGTHACVCLLWDSLAASQLCWSYCFSLCLAPSEYHNSLVPTRRQLRSAQFESRACKPNICLLIGRPPLWTEL